MEAFMLALRLRRKGIVYQDVEAVFGQIIIALVKTSTHMLLNSEPGMRIHQEFLLSADSQQQLVLLLLEKLGMIDTTKKGHIVFTYLCRIVQTRARNLVRDSHAAKRDTRVTDSFEGLDVTPVVSDFWGETTKAIKIGKITNTKKES